MRGGKGTRGLWGRHSALLHECTQSDLAVGEDKRIPPPESLVIGLNPPFGAGNLGNKFIMKAASFRPRVMILVVPPNTIIPQRDSWREGMYSPIGYS